MSCKKDIPWTVRYAMYVQRRDAGNRAVVLKLLLHDLKHDDFNEIWVPK